jgi:hypothetical protein
MIPTDEQLTLWADGELDPETTARIEAALAADPALAAKAEAQRRLRARVAAAYAPVAAEPVPKRLLALLSDPSEPAAAPRPAEVVDLAARRKAKEQPTGRKLTLSPRVLALAAAGIAAVVVLAPMLTNPFGGGSELVAYRGGVLAPGVPLRRALETAAGGETVGRVRVVFSFRTEAGVYCRTFAAADRSALSGLACREAEGWRLRALADRPLDRTGEFRTASAELAPSVLAAADELIEGEPLDAAGERSARQARWLSRP